MMKNKNKYGSPYGAKGPAKQSRKERRPKQDDTKGDQAGLGPMESIWQKASKLVLQKIATEAVGDLVGLGLIENENHVDLFILNEIIRCRVMGEEHPLIGIAMEKRALESSVAAAVPSGTIQTVSI